MTNLWNQVTLMESSELQVSKAYTDQREYQYFAPYLVALWDDFESLYGSSLHCTPLFKGDSIVNNLLVEENILKPHSNLISNKWVFYTPLLVFVALIHKEKYQGRIRLANHKCVFLKEKYHWKS